MDEDVQEEIERLRVSMDEHWSEIQRLLKKHEELKARLQVLETRAGAADAEARDERHIREHCEARASVAGASTADAGGKRRKSELSPLSSVMSSPFPVSADAAALRGKPLSSKLATVGPKSWARAVPTRQSRCQRPLIAKSVPARKPLQQPSSPVAPCTTEACGSSADLFKIMQPWDSLSMILRAAGYRFCLQIAAACKELSSTVRDASFAFSEWFPPCIVAIGGSGNVIPHLQGKLEEKLQLLDSVELLNPSSGSWQALAPLQQPRCLMAAVATRDCYVYVIGGQAEGQRPLASVERYDPDNGAWTEIPSLRVPRFGACAAEHGGAVYVMGGHDGREVVRSCEQLSRADRTWAAFRSGRRRWDEHPPLVAARMLASTAVVAGQLFVAGGVAQDRPASSVERLERGAWKIEALPNQITQQLSAYHFMLPSLPKVPRLRAASALVAGEGDIYVLGGCLACNQEKTSNAVERWDASQQRWEAAPAMQVSRDGAAAVALRGCAVI
eukprot:TRINITY_DN91018_c0_g1_i1.p1 TRINITY_DN91018_c0_g1~~TRINITY_DN91018_c0_g1_i1.p1  ORF type:complete len:533 (+),score=98.13 TRINITY_DN91018_c0_g1_i1:94-1599(+)